MKKRMYIFTTFLSSLLIISSQFDRVYAETSREGEAEIDLKKYKEEKPIIRDPENPEIEVNPGDTPQTTGDLRIDFVPTLNFSTVKITDNEIIFPVNAQLFHGETSARGNFIQVSDFRDNLSGWTLQVRQEEQFKHTTKLGVNLKGAVISFDQAWTNSVMDSSFTPLVGKEIIRMSNIGDTYDLAHAEPNKGFGTWSVVFGASNDNKNERPNSLKLRKDSSGKTIEDPIFKKPVYSNEAITLSVPNETEKVAGTYVTVLTWILAELP